MRSSSPQRRLRACVRCSQARARCHFQPGNVERHVCERCEMLGVACAAKSAAGLRRPRRIKRREGDGGGTDDGCGSERVPGREEHLCEQQQGTPESDSLPPPPPRRNTLPDPGVPDPPYGLSWARVDAILAMYTASYLPLFPFVVLPDSDKDTVSARDLWMTKPLLLRAVILATAPFFLLAPPSSSSMEATRDDVLGRLAQALLADDARSLEALQALLLCAAWADVRSLCDQRITSLTYLALGCAHAMGMTRPPRSVVRRLGRASAPADVLDRGKKGEEGGEDHSLAEQRAFLGLYVILGINSTQFGRPNPLDDDDSDAYVTHCGNRLRWTMERPTDAALDTAVRLARVGAQIQRAFGPTTGSANSNGAVRAAMRHRGDASSEYEREHGHEQEGIRPALDAILEGSGGLGEGASLAARLHYYYLLVRLYEPATLPVPAPAPAPPQHLGQDTSVSRSQCLDRCLDAVRSYLHLRLSVPASSPLQEALSSAAQSTYVVIIATRLLLLENVHAPPDVWDREQARRTLDLRGLMDRQAALLDEADHVRRAHAMGAIYDGTEHYDDRGKGANDSRLHLWAVGLRGIRDWIEVKMKGDTPPQPTQVHEDGSSENALATGLAEFESSVEGHSGPAWFAGMWQDVSWEFNI